MPRAVGGADEEPEEDADLCVEDRPGEAHADDEHEDGQADGRQVRQVRSQPLAGQTEHDQDPRQQGAAVEQPHRGAAVEQPAGELDLDVDRRRVEVGRVAEVDVHHPPAPDAGAEGILIEQFAKGVPEKLSAVLPEALHGALLGHAGEPLAHALAADRGRPEETRQDERAATGDQPARRRHATASEHHGRKHDEGADTHHQQRAHLREVESRESDHRAEHVEPAPRSITRQERHAEAEHRRHRSGNRCSTWLVRQPGRTDDDATVGALGTSGSPPMRRSSAAPAC